MRIDKGLHASLSETRSYMELTGLRLLPCVSGVRAGCRTPTCLRGTVAPSASKAHLSCLRWSIMQNVETPFLRPSAMLGQANRKAC